MQVKSATGGTGAKPEALLIPDSLKIPTMTTETITAFVDRLSQWNTTGTVNPVTKFTETVSLIIPPFNIKNRRQKDSSQSHQHNGVTLYDQQEHTNYRLRSHSGAIQVH